MNRLLVSTIAAAGLGITALPVHAANYIEGSLSFFGGFASLPAAPTSRIVSGLATLDIAPAAFASGGAGDLAGQEGAALAFDFDTVPGPELAYVTSGGFSFLITKVDVDFSEPLTCAASGCRDKLGLEIQGIVSGPGFLATPFAGKWTGNGACQGIVAGCVGAISGSWSASFTALPVPEPASLALLGIGLLGGAAASRRRVTRAVSG